MYIACDTVATDISRRYRIVLRMVNISRRIYVAVSFLNIVRTKGIQWVLRCVFRLLRACLASALKLRKNNWHKSCGWRNLSLEHFDRSLICHIEMSSSLSHLGKINNHVNIQRMHLHVFFNFLLLVGPLPAKTEENVQEPRQVDKSRWLQQD